jgi:enamine deaminase RidA (YjgF/YER057c/UK114 family)
MDMGRTHFTWSRALSHAPHPTLTAVGVTWLYGFQFEIKVIAKLPESANG